MDNQTKVALAAAIAGGYLLGRTKKGKLALSVATYLAGRRFGLEPRQLATEGMRRLGEIPQVAELQDQLKGEFLEAGRKAVTAAATRGMGTLAETLSDRTASLGKKEEKPKDEEEDEEEEEEEEPEDEEEGEEEPEEEEEEPEPKRSQRRRSSRKPARPERGTASGRERAPSAGRKKSSATKPAAKKAAPAKKSAARKQAPAKKAASSGRPAKRTSKRADRRR